jgi:hypothetical protein
MENYKKNVSGMKYPIMIKINYGAKKKVLNGEKFTGRKFNIAVTYVHKPLNKAFAFVMTLRHCKNGINDFRKRNN